MRYLLFIIISLFLLSCGSGSISQADIDDATVLALLTDRDDNLIDSVMVEDAITYCLADVTCLHNIERLNGNIYNFISSSSEFIIKQISSSSSPKSSSSFKIYIPVSSAIISTFGSSSSLEETIFSSSASIIQSSSRSAGLLDNIFCAVTKDEIVKGDSVTWSMSASLYRRANPNFNPTTYTWTFPEGSSILQSNDSTPTVSYSAVNLEGYSANLVIDKGLPTEITALCNHSVKVTGIRIKNCKCESSDALIVASSSKPKDITYTISGCEGADPFTYQWKTGVTGTTNTATTTITGGMVATATATITNSDDDAMNVTCPDITVTELPGASCSFANSAMPGGKTKFNVSNITGWTASESDVNMILANNAGDETEITVNRYYNGGWDITAPSELGEYTYSLKYLGESICDVALSVAYPKITSTGCKIGKNVWNSGKDYFSPGENSFSGWNSNVSSPQKMTLYLNDAVIVENKDVNNGYNTPQWQQITLPTEVGIHTFKLVYQGNTVCEVKYEVE